MCAGSNPLCPFISELMAEITHKIGHGVKNPPLGNFLGEQDVIVVQNVVSVQKVVLVEQF